MAQEKLAITNCIDCDINICLSLQRLVGILKVYENWLYYEQNKADNEIMTVLQQSLDSYSVTDILNDYHHIKERKYVFPSINKLCSRLSLNCIPTRRHRRDNNSNYKEKYFGKDIKNIIIQKLFDQIHLYLYHPFSNKIKKDGQQQSNVYQDIFENHRFGTKVITEYKQKNNDEYNVEDAEEEEEEKKQQLDQKNEQKYPLNEDIAIDFEKDAYNFGQQFFYWDHYREHHWFISSKYQNLKDELLSNSIYKLDQFDWDLEYKTAVDKLENDERVQALASNDEFKDKYDIHKDIAITMDHLLSILFYCNTNELENRFSATYRRLPNENDAEFKKRHRNFYFFAKLLREAVEVFGNVLVDEDLSLYHGIDHPLYFAKMIAKLYCPTSTTKNRVIAAYFAGNDGMILEFCKYERNAFYFDCFVSGYDREEEFLFMGGYAALKIKNILHFISEREEIENYSTYITLIENFLSVVQNKNIDQQQASSSYDLQIQKIDGNEDGDGKDNYYLKILIKNKCNLAHFQEITIPKYIIQLFAFRCNKINGLTIDLKDFSKISQRLNIHDICIDGQSGIININTFANIFPNIAEMKLIVPNTFSFNNQITQYLLENLVAFQSGVNFKHIEICFDMLLLPEKIKSEVIMLENEFANISWAITVENDEDYFESVFLINNPPKELLSEWEYQEMEVGDKEIEEEDKGMIHAFCARYWYLSNVIHIFVWILILSAVFLQNYQKQNDLVSHPSKGIYPEDTPQKYCCNCYHYALELELEPNYNGRTIDWSYCANCLNCTACQHGVVNQTYNIDQCGMFSTEDANDQCNGKYLTTYNYQFFDSGSNYVDNGIYTAVVGLIFVIVLICWLIIIRRHRVRPKLAGIGMVYYTLYYTVGVVCSYNMFQPFKYRKTNLKMDNENEFYCYVNTIDQLLDISMIYFMYLGLSVLVFFIICGFVRMICCIDRCRCNVCVSILGTIYIGFIISMLIAIGFFITNGGSGDDLFWIIVVNVMIIIVCVMSCEGQCKARCKLWYHTIRERRKERIESQDLLMEK